MLVFQLVSGALYIFFASTLYAASVALYAGTFDPPTRSEERIIRCALGDPALSRQCQEIGQEISRVVVLVNEDDELDTLASTRERVLMVKKGLEDYSGRVEVVASTPAQMAERVRTLLADQYIEQLFYLIGLDPLQEWDSIPARYHNKIVRVRFPLEQHEGKASQATGSTPPQVSSPAKEVIMKLGLYQTPAEDLAQLQRSLFEEGWRAFLDDLNSACPDTVNREICGALASKWESISIITDDQRKEVSIQSPLVYNQSQSANRWAEKFSKTATKFLEGSDNYRKFRAVADDIAARTLEGYPSGRLPHLKRVSIEKTSLPVESFKVGEKPVFCHAPQGPYRMDMDRYVADRFPRAFVRFLQDEFQRTNRPIDLYVHNHPIDEAYEFHRRDRFDTWYFLQTKRGHFHRQIYLAVKSEPRSYRVVFAAVRGNDRQANVLCQIHRAGIFANYRFVHSNHMQPLFVLNSQGASLRLDQNDLLLFGFKGNWSRALAAANWQKTPLIKEGLDIDLFTHPANSQKLVVARNVYGDDTDVVLDTFYKKGLRQVIYLGTAGAIADYQIGDLVIPNEFVNGNSDTVPFQTNWAHDFQAAMSSLVTVHRQTKHGWVQTLFDESEDLLLNWRAQSIGAVDIEGLHLARFARRHPDLKMAVFFVISDETLGDSTINESNARRAVIDTSVNKLISFLVPKLQRP